MTPDRFPIMDRALTSIPWAMIAPHEERALRNHDQTLACLAHRGGLSPHEALLVLSDQPWDGRIFVLPRQRAERDAFMALQREELRRRLDAWHAANPAEPQPA